MRIAYGHLAKAIVAVVLFFFSINSKSPFGQPNDVAHTVHRVFNVFHFFNLYRMVKKYIVSVLLLLLVWRCKRERQEENGLDKRRLHQD